MKYIVRFVVVWFTYTGYYVHGAKEFKFKGSSGMENHPYLYEVRRDTCKATFEYRGAAEVFSVIIKELKTDDYVVDSVWIEERED